MPLPKISVPTFDVTVPIMNRKYKVRPMLVKEEKILLMAKQSEDRADQLNALKQVVQNCVVGDVNTDNMAFFEMEYLFLKIRSASISSKGKAAFKDNEDNKTYNFDIDLDKVELKVTKEASPTIDLGGGITITLIYPPSTLFTSKEFFSMDDAKAFELVLGKCIAKIFKGEETFDAKQATPEEMAEFINSIPSKAYEKIQDFFNSIPTLYYKIEYQNSMGTKRTIEMTTLDDFFTFG